MMQSGMACETGTVDLSDAAHVYVSHSLQSDNIIGILQRRNQDEMIGTNCMVTLVVIPPSFSTTNIGSSLRKGFYVARETRTTSTTGGYNVADGYSQYYNPQPSFRFECRSTNYKFSGTYDYILIAMDVFRSHNCVPYSKKSLNLASVTAPILVSNPFGSSDHVLAMAIKKEPEYGVNGLDGSVMYNGNNSIWYVQEVRTSWANYATSYATASYAHIYDNEISFGVRNGGYRYLPGDYDILLIKFPPFEVTE